VQKINDFEYKVLSPGSSAADYQAFANWEQSLETLRKKRCNRLKIKHLASKHAGQARVLKIYDRGVYRHPGSIELWKDYLHYAAKIKATKRWRKVMSTALRMRPTEPELWILAGRHSERNRNMNSARDFFMRGCRFCSQDAALWVEYARCEMLWLRRMEAKTKGNEQAHAFESEQIRDEDAIMLVDEGNDDEEVDEDRVMTVPEPLTEPKVFTQEESKKLAEKTPAMDGAIPMAIFDVAKKQPFFNAPAAEAFFDLFAGFDGLSVHQTLAQHVVDTMTELYPENPSTCSCYIRQPVIAVDPRTPEFPRALREVLGRLKSSLETTTDEAALKGKMAAWIDSILGLRNLTLQSELSWSIRRRGCNDAHQTLQQQKEKIYSTCMSTILASRVGLPVIVHARPCVTPTYS
jgi:U3 small nucleolar RNA-associated protein 6